MSFSPFSPLFWTAPHTLRRVCRTLRFEDKPDYSYMRKLFRDLFIKEGYQVSTRDGGGGRSLSPWCSF